MFDTPHSDSAMSAGQQPSRNTTLEFGSETHGLIGELSSVPAPILHGRNVAIRRAEAKVKAAGAVKSRIRTLCALCKWIHSSASSRREGPPKACRSTSNHRDMTIDTLTVPSSPV